MIKSSAVKIQIGKQGLNQGTLTTIKNALKAHGQARVHLLKSAEKERQDPKATAQSIQKSLENDFKLSLRTLGFVLIVTKLKVLKKSQ